MKCEDLTELIICEWMAADPKTKGDVLSVLRLYAFVKEQRRQPERQRGKDRQNRPAQRQNADQKCRQKARKLVKLTQHDAPPFENRDHRP